MIRNMPTKSDIRTIDKKIGIIVVTDEKELAALRSFIQSMPPAPPIEQDKPQQDEIIAGYISRYIDKDASVLSGILEILKGTDLKQKKRLLHAINGIRKNIDPSFRITEPEMIEALFSLIKYKSLEWPLIELLTTYKLDGYILILRKWLANPRASVIGSILSHLVFIGQYDCLRIVEKLTARRRTDLVQWPLILMVLKSINGYYGNAVAPYIQAIIIQLFRRKIISMEGLQKHSMKEFQMHYMHFLCLYGTSEAGPYIEEITPFLQKDYLAYFRYRMGITTDYNEIFSAMQAHNWYATYNDFARNVRPHMTEEWQVCMMQYFLRKMWEEGYSHHLHGIEALCHAICGPDFIKDHISLIEDADTANSLLRLHVIRNLPAETILSDMLSVGLLKDVPKERALELIRSAQRNAPQALFGYIMEQLPGKFNTDACTGTVSDGVYVQQHILQWAKDCGTILDGLYVHVEEDENGSLGLVKAVFHDRGYILKKLPDTDVYDLELARALLNTLLEYANVPERLIEISFHFEGCLVSGNVQALQALAAKYDYTKSA
jgi:hypothetical protein